MSATEPINLAQPGHQAQAQLVADPHRYGHHPDLAHHFDDLEQQRDADTLGMWAFLATELMFFGGVFGAFAIYRILYTQSFANAAGHLSVTMGTTNTFVLLFSSFTVVLAVNAAHHNQSRKAGMWFFVTIGLAVAFLVIKGFEYHHDWEIGLVPALRDFGFDKFPDGRQQKLFFLFYFPMTMIHALHMIIGIGVFAVVGYKAWKGRYSDQYYNPIEVSGLYWHFVDLIWVFLFPTLYLLRA